MWKSGLVTLGVLVARAFGGGVSTMGLAGRLAGLAAYLGLVLVAVTVRDPGNAGTLLRAIARRSSREKARSALSPALCP